MSDEPISALAPGTTVSDTDLLPNVQVIGVGPVKTTALQLKTYNNASPSFTGTATFSGAATFNGATTFSVSPTFSAGLTTTNITASGTVSATDISASNNITATNSVATGSLSVSGAATVGGNLSVTGNATVNGTLYAPNFALVPSTAGSVLFTGSGGSISQNNSNFYWSNTNNALGIGTSSPTSFGSGLEIHNPSSYSSVLLTSGAVTGEFLISETNGVAAVGTRTNNTFNIVTNDTSRITITNGGNVGVGNLSPTEIFCVGSSGGSNGKITLFGSSSGSASIVVPPVGGAYNFNLPANEGVVGQVLTSGGGGSAPMYWSSVTSASQPVNIENYGAIGDGIYNNAVAFASANSAPNLYIPSGNFYIGSDVTFNVAVIMYDNAQITIPNGVTLTFNAPFVAARYQTFNCQGTGKVVFNTEYTTTGYPEWWGAVCGGPDCWAALTACTIACPITDLGVGDYYITQTLKINTEARILRGNGWGYKDNGVKATTICTTSPTINILQIGPDSAPGGGINAYLLGVQISGINFTRLTPPNIASQCSGILIQWTLFCRLDKCYTEDNINGFYISQTVQTHLTNCTAFRTSTGVGSGDYFNGFTLNGSVLIGSGGNASTYITDCDASVGGNITLSKGGSTGLLIAYAGADTFVLRFESSSCAIGITVLGTAATPSATAADADIHFVGCIIDAFATWGIRLYNCNKSSAISIVDCYFAPTTYTGISVSAGIGIDTCAGPISLSNNQTIGLSATTGIGLYIYNSTTVNAISNIHSDWSGGGIVVTGSSLCKIQDTINNQYNTAGVPALLGNSSTNRCYFAPIINGKTNAFTSGVNLTGCTYNETNVTNIFPLCLTGGATAKLVINGTNITTSSFTANPVGTGNIATGAMG